ncbi:MAG TPA: YggS family pyridoxal phosphate-dependent enzyme [Polyangiaceae bacterium]|nr:YggS family pyridoxal phosphate-dependent enzyme [Polyangiaceae bacterium]
MTQSVAQGLQVVRAEIARAAQQAKRDPAQVRLIAVSKGQPTQKIRDAYAAGQRDFGESYVQELQQKATDLADLPELCWHLIGHLQRNKARHAVKVCQVVHSVDSAGLAHELANRLRGSGAKPLRVLAEVNVGREPQKHGVLPEGLEELLGTVEQQPELHLVGLMTIPPNTDRAEESLQYFQMLRDLRDQHGGTTRLPELSMGMSSDFEQAIHAGATWVRVGTAIFGART